MKYKKSQLNAISCNYSRIRRVRSLEYLKTHHLESLFEDSGYKNPYVYLKNVHGVDVDIDFKKPYDFYFGRFDEKE